MPRAERGFTLLEVLVALAIAALGIAAVAKATGSAATVAGETRERMIAVWVAGNRLTELRLTRAWPATGSRDLVRSMGGRSWYLTQTVAPAGDDDDLRRVEVVVYTDAERSDREFAVHGYVARYRSAAELAGPARAGDPQAPQSEDNASPPGQDDEPAAGDDVQPAGAGQDNQ